MYKLNKHTIVTDANSFTANGVRFLLYRNPNKERNDGIVISLKDGEKYPFSWDKFLKYFANENDNK